MSNGRSLDRRAFLGMAAAATAGGAMSRAASGAPRRPNVLLIMTDDQGYGDLGCHGNTQLRTPNLDRLAAQSVQFSRFHVCPVCAPTRASLMTGRYNYRTGAIDTYLGRAMMHPEETTLAEHLGAAGYRTGIFGKWHLGDHYPLRAMDQGFQESLVHRGGGIGQPSDPPGGEHYLDPILTHNGRLGRHAGYCTDIFTDAAIRFIEAERDRPFFAYLATNAPHAPLEVAETDAAPYRAMRLDDNVARTYGMIANVDENIGRLLARLTALGLDERTIVVFLTDNGPAGPRFNAGMRGRKGAVYDGGIRVPCFVRWTRRFAPGRPIDRIAAHIDLAPTLLEACGVPAAGDAAFDGRSLLPLLDDPRAQWPDRTLFFQWHRGDEPVAFRACAVREPRYKLIDGKELYDMVEDPGETRDLAAGQPERVARMRQAYEAWFRDVSATRGYAPPRIQIGTPHEYLVTLTRQDWRGPRAGWNADSLGHWEVEVARPGRYEVTLRFARLARPSAVRVRFGNVERKRESPANAESLTFESVNLPAGKGMFEAWLEAGEQTVGVHQVDVKRLEP